MGCELVTCTPATESNYRRRYTDEFERKFPFYLSIGMTYEQYWQGDSELARYYRKAYQLKKKRKNQELWLQGAYIYEVLIDVAPILHAFAKETARPKPYLEEPFPLSVSEARDARDRDRANRKKELKSKMDTWAAEMNSKIDNREVAQDG